MDTRDLARDVLRQYVKVTSLADAHDLLFRNFDVTRLSEVRPVDLPRLVGLCAGEVEYASWFPPRERVFSIVSADRTHAQIYLIRGEHGPFGFRESTKVYPVPLSVVPMLIEQLQRVAP